MSPLARSSRLLALAIVVLGAGGCAGTATVLRQDAGSVSDAAKEVVADVRVFYNEQATRRLGYYLDAVAADPGCRADSTLLVIPQHTGPQPFRCMTDAERDSCRSDAPPPLCATLQKIELLPETPVYQTVLTLVGVVADYQDLLAKLAATSPVDTGGDLKNLLARLQNLQTQLKTVLPALDVIPATNDALTAQLGAVGSLIDVVREAADAARALDALKVALAEHGPAFETALGELASRYENVDLMGRRLMEREALEARRRAFNDGVSSGANAKLTPAQRRQQLASILDADRARREVLAQPDPIATALRALQRSHVQLRDAVLNGNLSAEQRQRIADENVKTLRATLKAIGSVAKAFL